MHIFAGERGLVGQDLHPLDIIGTAVRSLYKLEFNLDTGKSSNAELYYMDTINRLMNTQTMGGILAIIEQYYQAAALQETQGRPYSAPVAGAILEIQNYYGSPVTLNSTADKLQPTD